MSNSDAHSKHINLHACQPAIVRTFMTNTSPHILLIAGEESGDLRGAELIRAVRQRLPSVRVSAVGGARMAAEGASLIANVTDLAVIGFTDVLKHYPRLRSVFRTVTEFATRERPDAIILIDYPGFNLRLAKKLKPRGVKLIYYISPQVWAWKEKRIALIKRVIDRMIVLFPFEKEFYAERHGMIVDAVGHPLVDEVRTIACRETFLSSIGFDAGLPVLGLLPGSRGKEVERHMPIMIAAARRLLNSHPDMQCVVLRASTLAPEAFASYLKDYPGRLHLTDHYYDGLNSTDAAIVCSGTATLETALLNKPMSVIYKTSPLSYNLFRMFIKIPYISLVNIVTREKMVNEWVQKDATPENLAADIEPLLFDEGARARMVAKLGRVRTALGEPGASDRAGAIIVEELMKDQRPETRD